MSAANHPMYERERPSPRPKAPRLSPELDEVLRMLKALEEQPEGDTGFDSSR
ncbi:MAG: hypothetical protein ACOC71_01375 [Hyphomicrobiales bacterium]